MNVVKKENNKYAMVKNIAFRANIKTSDKSYDSVYVL